MNKDPNIEAITKALAYAKRKHPFFAHFPIEKIKWPWAQNWLEYQREKLRTAIGTERSTGIDILACEVAEAGEAYAKGDKKACIKELAQCAAVIIRMMEMVREEANNE